MVTLFRAMSLEEYDKTSENYLSYLRNKEKPFGTKEFVLNRVCDGKFNNSNFKPKYTHLIQIEFDEKYKTQFHKWGNKEALLMNRKCNFPFKITKLGEIKNYE